MPPKSAPKGGRTLGAGPGSEPNYAHTVYQTITGAENRSVVTAIGMFAVGVTFLHSSWAEILLPA